jgi:hypothetical protein
MEEINASNFMFESIHKKFYNQSEFALYRNIPHANELHASEVTVIPILIIQDYTNSAVF